MNTFASIYVIGMVLSAIPIFRFIGRLLVTDFTRNARLSGGDLVFVMVTTLLMSICVVAMWPGFLVVRLTTANHKRRQRKLGGKAQVERRYYEIAKKLVGMTPEEKERSLQQQKKDLERRIEELERGLEV